MTEERLESRERAGGGGRRLLPPARGDGGVDRVEVAQLEQQPRLQVGLHHPPHLRLPPLVQVGSAATEQAEDAHDDHAHRVGRRAVRLELGDGCAQVERPELGDHVVVQPARQQPARVDMEV